MNALVRQSLSLALILLVASTAHGAPTTRAQRAAPAAPAAPTATTAAPSKIQYSGSLVDAATGVGISGPTSLQFRIFDAAVLGTELWTETQSVQVHKGVFHAFLGASTPFPVDLFEGGSRFLELQVGADSPMSPRVELAKVPNAFFADKAEHAANSDHASNSDHAANSDHAGNSDHAANSDHAGNSDHAANSDHAGNSDHATSSDNLVCVGCITTIHLAAGAVTTEKISATGTTPGQVLTSTGASLIWQAPATTSGTLDCVGCVTSGHLAAGAVTTEKISAPGTTAGLVLTSTGSSAVWQAPLLGSTHHVVMVGAAGTPTQNGTALISALADITDAPTAGPYLVKLGPGRFLMPAKLVMKPGVDIEGSGEQQTIIEIGSGKGLEGAASSELRGVTVLLSGYIQDLARASQLTIVSSITGGDIFCGVPATYTNMTFRALSPVSIFGLSLPLQRKVTFRNCSLVGGMMVNVPEGDTLEVIGCDIEMITAPSNPQSAGILNEGVLIIRNSTLRTLATAAIINNQVGGVTTIAASEIGGPGRLRNSGDLTIHGSQLSFTSFENIGGTAFVGGSYIATGLHLGGVTTCYSLYGGAGFFATTCP